MIAVRKDLLLVELTPPTFPRLSQSGPWNKSTFKLSKQEESQHDEIEADDASDTLSEIALVVDDALDSVDTAVV